MNSELRGMILICEVLDSQSHCKEPARNDAISENLLFSENDWDAHTSAKGYEMKTKSKKHANFKIYK